MNPIFSGSQEKILVNSQEGINTQVEEFQIDKGPEYMSFLFDMYDEESGQILAICSDSDIEVKDLEQNPSTVKKETGISFCACKQEEILDTSYPFLCIDQQVVFTHVLQDPFVVLLDLETSEKEILMGYLESVSGLGSLKWMSFEVKDNFQFELSSRRFFTFLLSKDMQGIQMVDKVLAWLH
jgi:hypothetical protein